MTFSYDDVRRLASDPETNWDTLHWIAEEYPELRPDVAANPSTYPELLEALADLDDPAITAALMRRFNPDEAPPPGAEAEAAAEPAAESASGALPDAEEPEEPGKSEDPDDADEGAAGAAGVGPAEDSAASSPAASAVASTPAGPVDAPAGDQSGEDATDEDATEAEQDGPVPPTAGPAAAGGAGADGADGAAADTEDADTDAAGAGAAWAGAAAQTPREEPARRRPRLGAILLAVVLPLVALAAITALVLALLGDSGAPQGEGDEGLLAESEEPTTAESAEDGSASPSTSPSPSGPTLEEVRTALQELPEDSSCDDVTDDVEVFTAFAGVAAEESWQDEDDELVQSTLEDLQGECGALQSAQVHQQLLDRAEEDLAAAAEDMGTEWIEQSNPAAGGEEISSFITPSGNIVCDLGEELRCRVLDHDFPAPEGCDADGITYRTTLSTTASPDCENPVPAGGGRQTLQHGQTAANDYFACQSFPAKLSCWNQLSGEGFNLSRSGHSRF